MLTTSKLDLIVQCVMKQTGVYPLAKSSKRKFVRARELAIMLCVNLFYSDRLHKHKTPGCWDIFKLTGWNHSTVHARYMAALDHYEYEKDFKLDYDLSLHKYRKLVQVGRRKYCTPTEYNVIRIVHSSLKGMLIGVN